MSVLIYPEFFQSRRVESRTVDLSWQDLPVDSRPFYYLHDHVVAVSLVIAVYHEIVNRRPKVAFWCAPKIRSVQSHMYRIKSAGWVRSG
jgi:hypothetical protein